MWNWDQEEKCHLPRGRGVPGSCCSMLLEGPASPHGALCARGLSCVPWPGLACRLMESSKCSSLPNACCIGLVLGSGQVPVKSTVPSFSRGVLGLRVSLSLFPLPPWAFSALKAVVPALGDGRSFVPSGRLVVVWTCSRPSLLRWKPATDSPATFLRVRIEQGGVAPPCPLAAPLVHTSCLGPSSGCFPTSLAIAAPVVNKSVYRSL